MLEIDGEVPYSRSKIPSLLYISHRLLQSSTAPGYAWWNARVGLTHQQLLEHPVESLRTRILHSLDQCCPGGGRTKAIWHIERSIAFHRYHDDRAAGEEIEKAAEEAQFQFQLSGQLGKRTKFQENNITQLVVLAESSSMPTPSKSTTVQYNRALDDDTLLENPHLEGDTSLVKNNLDVVDQCILLAYWYGDFPLFHLLLSYLAHGNT
jgi:hypothetical protein